MSEKPYRTIEFKKISELKLLDHNPRKIKKEQFDKLCVSLEKDPGFFEARPCLVNDFEGNLTVYAGNQRVKAAKKIGWKEVPCIIEKDMCPLKMKERVIKDNKTYGDFDFDMLANEWDLEVLFDAGFSALDFSGSEDLDEEKKSESKEKKKKKISCPDCGYEMEI